MRIIETEAYTFDELSDDAKEKAKIELVSEYFWSDDAIASLYAFADEIGIKITDYSIDFSGYSHNSISWEWIIDEHKNDLSVEELTGYCADYPLIDEWNKTKDVDGAIDAWVNDCQKDYEYQQSDEYMFEHCESNEYEFTKEGKLI
jgi:hypothetical protein